MISRLSKDVGVTFIIPSQHRWRGYSNAAVCLWFGEWAGASVSPCVSPSVHRALPCGHDRDYSFCPITFNFTCKLFMMRGGTLLILGQRVKGQGQLGHFVYKTLWARYRLQFLPNYFQTSHVSSSWREEEPYLFWVTGSKVKVKISTSPMKPCGHNTDYSFCPITFKLHM